MKKLTITLLAITATILMITSVYAIPPTAPPPDLPEPPTCGTCSGFTPGFWKHNIKVRLGLTNGKYSAFSRDGTMYLAGTKLTDTIMDDLLSAINTQYGTSLTFAELYTALRGPGWSADRTNAANLFNEAAGYGPY